MTAVPTNVPEGQTNSTESNGQEPQPPIVPVNYETHRKVLSEKKVAMEKLEALQAQLAERDRKEMEARGEFQKIAEAEKARADAAEKRARDYEENELVRKKAVALLKSLDNTLPQKYHHMLPVEKVLIDPDTGEVNATSLAALADEFRRDYPEILIPKNGARFPNQAPQSNGAGTIAYEDWKKLPSKEMDKWPKSQIIG